MGDCRKFHSTYCLFPERWYTKTVFGCGFSGFHCAIGYALKYFSDVAYISSMKKRKKTLKRETMKYAVNIWRSEAGIHLKAI